MIMYPESMKGDRSRITTGISAEYFVAAELSRRGLYASITLKNTPGIDILAADESGSRVFFIQVKSKKQMGKGGTKAWLLSKGDESIIGKDFFYVFVNLNNKKFSPPDIYIVPSKVVSSRIRENHRKFLEGGGKDTPMRVFKMEKKGEEVYLNNWGVFCTGPEKDL